ncbi:MAG: GNAT family N-acetyltransferase [Firmicutes bacterium]|nr:GNAT family N-acetyltransferase [Bacillota bacterium]
MIIFTDDIRSVSIEKLDGFFIGWPNPPSREVFLKLLDGSDYAVVAIDESNDNVVGFITCISDNILTAYIPLLEVLPEYQNQGIGAKLMRMVFEKYHHLYKVDLCCDLEMQEYYSRFEMIKIHGMSRIKYQHQSGFETMPLK